MSTFAPRVPRLPRAVLQRGVEVAPGLARVAASAAWHTTEWGVRTSVRTGRRAVRATGSSEEAAALLDDVTGAVEVVGDLARRVSGGTSLGRALIEAGAFAVGIADHLEHAEPDDVTQAARAAAYAEGADAGQHGDTQPGLVVRGSVMPPRREHSRVPEATLRERGQELLRRSRDVWADDVDHPAYGRILSEVAPDEARVLLLLLEGGPQPSVDVRTGGPVALIGSQLLAAGLTMIGGRAGCRHLEQVPSYLNNLFRLGLVWFSREPLRDPMDYQVLEAQPEVLTALHSARFTRVVRRSIHLTPFGEDFCRACLVDVGKQDATFPEHADPDDDGSPAA